jgi:hypothetical protein
MLSLRIRLAPSLAIAATLLAAFVFPVKSARAQVQTNSTASNPPTTRLKVTSNLVVVRVVVRDAQGKPVNGLRKEDFKLFDYRQGASRSRNLRRSLRLSQLQLPW